MKKKIPETVASYSLIHTNNGTPAYAEAGHKFGGHAKFDGSNYITIADNTILNQTDKITLIGFTYLPANDAASHIIFTKDAATAQYAVFAAALAGNEMIFRTNSTGQNDIQFTYTPNTWFHFAMTFKNTPENRMRLYIDAVKQGVDLTTSGNLVTTTTAVSIGATDTGSFPLLSGSRLSWLSVLHAELTQQSITDHFNGLVNTSDGNDEITTIPFIGPAWTAESNATSGQCRST